MSDTSLAGQGNLRVLLGVLAAVVVLGVVWFFVVSPLLLGDDGAVEAGDGTATAEESAPTAPASPGEVEEDVDADAVSALPVETYEIFLSRDPFEPIVPEAGGGGGTDGDGAGVPDVLIIDTDGDGVPDAPDEDGDGSPDGDGDGTPDGDGVQHDAVLIDVFVDDNGEARALVRVGDRIYTVGEGDAFADGYTVEAIVGTCVTLTYHGDTFTLCEGGGGSGDPDGGGSGDPDEGGSGTDDGRCAARNGDVVCEGRAVTLIDVYTSDGEAIAVVQVDSTLYEVRRGDDFAGNFRVVSIDPPCATLLYGDDAFTLCEGQRTLK